MDADTVLAILAMGLASQSCRLGGFYLMGFVAITPRVEGWLRAIPVALIGAVLGPVAARGGPAEWAGLAIALAVMKASGNEFAAAALAVAAVAGIRALG